MLLMLLMLLFSVSASACDEQIKGGGQGLQKCDFILSPPLLELVDLEKVLNAVHDTEVVFEKGLLCDSVDLDFVGDGLGTVGVVSRLLNLAVLQLLQVAVELYQFCLLAAGIHGLAYALFELILLQIDPIDTWNEGLLAGIQQVSPEHLSPPQDGHTLLFHMPVFVLFPPDPVVFLQNLFLFASLGL